MSCSTYVAITKKFTYTENILYKFSEFENTINYSMASRLKMTFLFGRDTLQGDVMDDSCAGIHIHATLFCSFVLSIREATLISFLGLSTSLLFADCRPREYKQILTGALVLAGGLSPQVAYSHTAQKRQRVPNCLIGNHSLFFWCFFF